MHLENYPSHNSPTGFTDEPIFLNKYRFVPAIAATYQHFRNVTQCAEALFSDTSAQGLIFARTFASVSFVTSVS